MAARPPQKYKWLYVDCETFSDMDLGSQGMYRYVDSHVFAILLVCVSIEGREPVVYDLDNGDELPDDIIAALRDERVIKVAHNANFDRICLAKYYGHLQPRGWMCTMAMANVLGMPGRLGKLAELLKIEGKQPDGPKLIKMFCTPNRINLYQIRMHKSDACDEWECFKQYCKQDVVTGLKVFDWLRRSKCMTDLEWSTYWMDQRINDRGVKLDENLIMHVLNVAEEFKSDVSTETAKFFAMERVVCSFGRAKGLLKYHGAKTGRWTSNLINLHNLPRHGHSIDEVAEMRAMMMKEDVDGLAKFGDLKGIVKSLTRTAFTADYGSTLVVCDYNAIEPRILAWLAGEKWLLDVFRTGKPLYESVAAKLFGVDDIDDVTKEQRSMAKGATLALGYGGKESALQKQLHDSVSFWQCADIRKRWELEHNAIVQFWGECGKGFQSAIDGKPYQLGPLKFEKFGSFVCILLPSGRRLFYAKPKRDENPAGDGFTYMRNTGQGFGTVSINQCTICENIVQAIARDVLADAMLSIDKVYESIVFHVHDEVVLEVPEAKADETLKNVTKVFATAPRWARDLPLKGEGYISNYYLKQ